MTRGIGGVGGGWEGPRQSGLLCAIEEKWSGLSGHLARSYTMRGSSMYGELCMTRKIPIDHYSPLTDANTKKVPADLLKPFFYFL